MMAELLREFNNLLGPLGLGREDDSGVLTWRQSRSRSMILSKLRVTRDFDPYPSEEESELGRIVIEGVVLPQSGADPYHSGLVSRGSLSLHDLLLKPEAPLPP